MGKNLTYYYMEAPDLLIPEDRIDFHYDYHTTNHLKKDELFIKDESGLFEYDFADSFRIRFFDTEHCYNLIITDKNNTKIINKIFKPEKDVIYVYCKKYFIDYKIIICKCENEVPILPPFKIINYNANEQPVCVYLAYYNGTRSGVGDTIAWMNAIGYFMEKFPKCKMNIVTEFDNLNNLIPYTDFGKKYDITFLGINDARLKNFYATYTISYFYGDPFFNHTRLYCKDHSILEIGCDVMGIENYSNENPSIHFELEKKKPEKPYVCIGTHSSTFYKEWYANDGWDLVVKFLKYNGYDVYAIDEHNVVRYNLISQTKTPNGVIDDTGNKPLIDRVNRLINADFFIGGPSGLSWLAWWCEIPVVMISGFSLEKSEFKTPYRIINKNVCFGCWNDKLRDYDWQTCCCPRYNDSPNNPNFLICSRYISPASVISYIKKIPTFKEHTNGNII